MPPNDPRFLDLRREEILVEYWAHQYAENPKLDQTEIVDDDFDKDAILRAMEENPDDWEDVT